jgi:hypothetical protein
MIEATIAHVTDPAPLSRDRVLRTALAIIDQDGVEGSSMRRPGRDPTALYRYAAGKPALLDGVAELVLDELAVDTQHADWAKQLRTVARDFPPPRPVPPQSRPAARHAPAVHPSDATGHRVPLRPLEATLALLTRAGFTTAEALHVYRLFFGLLHGHVLNELQEVVDNREETVDLLRLGLHRLPLREFPLLRGLAGVLVDDHGAAEVERGLDVLLSGLKTQLHPAAPPATGQKGRPQGFNG